MIFYRDDGWWECENANEEKGYLPKNFLKPYIKYSDVMQEEPTTPVSPRSGKALWGNVKKALTEVSILKNYKKIVFLSSFICYVENSGLFVLHGFGIQTVVHILL